MKSTQRSLLARLHIVASFAALAVGLACDQPPSTSSDSASDSNESGDSSPAIGVLRSGLDAAGGGVVVEIDLSHGLGERAGNLDLFSGPSQPSLAELVLSMKRAEDDRRTRGFFVRLGGADLDWAQAEELGRIFQALKPEHQVVCHAHAYSNATLFFAARGCDRLWLSPAGEVGTVGIAGQMVYLKRLLDRFQVKADFLHMGKYKSAAETLTEDGPTEAARESLTTVLGSIRSTWLEGLSAARPRDKMQHDVEHGPWSPEAALADGLIDSVGYVSDARDEAKKLAQVDRVDTSIGVGERRGAAEAISELIQVVAGTHRSEGGDDHVVILTAAGGINMESGGVIGGGDGIAAEPLGKTLKRLREDDAVKAVVLRIDSPGGSALASDLLWHDLMLLREKKPLIASLANVAASGGYYMACAASRIVAERTTILGSIGVVGGKIVFGSALDQFGVSGVTLPASNEPGAAERAAYLSPLTEWDEPTREAVRAQMASIYELFLSRVAKGRDLPIDHVRPIAEGRIWSGVQGLDHRLIDEFGGLTEAIALAKKQAGLDESAEVRIEGGPESLVQLLHIEQEDDEPESIARALTRLRAQPPSPLLQLAEPFRPYAESLLPLLGREKVLAALPFAIQLR
ncbi:MAG TPA: S49 family peptidase [Polyangiaceae bacterium]|nr:S49 family peptidase [Polyangiaceae bacterium]